MVISEGPRFVVLDFTTDKMKKIGNKGPFFIRDFNDSYT